MAGVIVGAMFLLSAALWTIALDYHREAGDAGLLDYVLPPLTLAAAFVWIVVAFTS